MFKYLSHAPSSSSNAIGDPKSYSWDDSEMTCTDRVGVREVIKTTA